MTLKNYTSSVPASTTIAYIESYLAACGVSGISKFYKDGRPEALFFEATEDGRTFTIRLPAQVEDVLEYLWADYLTSVTKPRKKKEDFADQAMRCAWKIQQDWVQVQMSLVKLKQAKILQVFLAFVWTGDKTLYQHLKNGGLKMLPEKTT